MDVWDLGGGWVLEKLGDSDVWVYPGDRREVMPVGDGSAFRITVDASESVPESVERRMATLWDRFADVDRELRLFGGVEPQQAAEEGRDYWEQPATAAARQVVRLPAPTPAPAAPAPTPAAPASDVVAPEVVGLPADVRLVAGLAAEAVAESIQAGTDTTKAVVDVRFAIGVRLKGALPGTPGAETGSAWLFGPAGAEGPGWQAASSWAEATAAIDSVGVGGLTLFAPTGTGGPAVFVHNGRDDISRVVTVHPGGRTDVAELEYYRNAFRAPGSVLAIDPCAEVHVPSDGA